MNTSQYNRNFPESRIFHSGRITTRSRSNSRREQKADKLNGKFLDTLDRFMHRGRFDIAEAIRKTGKTGQPYRSFGSFGSKKPQSSVHWSQ